MTQQQIERRAAALVYEKPEAVDPLKVAFLRAQRNILSQRKQVAVVPTTLIPLACFCFAMLSGCGGGLTQSQQINAIKLCTDAGLRPEVIYNGLDYSISRVNCAPQETK